MDIEAHEGILRRRTKILAVFATGSIAAAISVLLLGMWLKFLVLVFFGIGLAMMALSLRTSISDHAFRCFKLGLICWLIAVAAFFYGLYAWIF